mgnify:CR=1 FL=1
MNLKKVEQSFKTRYSEGYMEIMKGFPKTIKNLDFSEYSGRLTTLQHNVVEDVIKEQEIDPNIYPVISGLGIDINTFIMSMTLDVYLEFDRDFKKRCQELVNKLDA